MPDPYSSHIHVWGTNSQNKIHTHTPTTHHIAAFSWNIWKIILIFQNFSSRSYIFYGDYNLIENKKSLWVFLVQTSLRKSYGVVNTHPMSSIDEKIWIGQLYVAKPYTWIPSTKRSAQSMWIQKIMGCKWTSAKE